MILSAHCWTFLHICAYLLLRAGLARPMTCLRWDLPLFCTQLEKATKKRRGRPTRVDVLDGWVRRTVEIFSSLDSTSPSFTPHTSNSPDPHSHPPSISPSTVTPRSHLPPLPVPIPPLVDPLLSSMITSEAARRRKVSYGHSTGRHSNLTSAPRSGSGVETRARTTRAAARKLEKGIVGEVDWRRENLEG